MSEDKGQVKGKGVRHVMNSLLDMPVGSHTLLVYPDLATLREVYAKYISMNSHGTSELLVILPYYETVESVKNNIMNRDSHMDKYKEMVHEGSLIIRDCHDIIHGNGKSFDVSSNNDENEIERLGRFLKQMLFHAKKIGKNTVSLWIDTGAFHTSEIDSDSLIKYEKCIPSEFRNSSIKQFCLYHQMDFELRFDRIKEKQILDSHDKKLLMLDNV